MSLRTNLRFLGGLGMIVIVVAASLAGYVTRSQWLPLLSRAEETHDEETKPPVEQPKVLRLSPEAAKNLKLTASPVKLQEYWRKIQIPGVVADRPGLSDRGVTSPAVGVVTKVHVFAGDTVKPGAKLFTLRLFSEYLQNTQSELFKATRETELIQDELRRIEGLAQSGTIAGNRIIELQQRISRQDVLVQAYRQDLLTRGLSPEQVAEIAQGNFVSSIYVVAPPVVEIKASSGDVQPVAFTDDDRGGELVYEVQELKVDLGQQVQAGQLLSVLSNHRSLYLEGHAFKQESSQLERAAQNGWEVEVEFAEDNSGDWPELEQEFQIRHLSNTIDTKSRTFDFYIPLQNQSRIYEADGQLFVVWRFRPGQRVRLHVPVEYLDKAIVLDAAAVVREGPEAYVFRQNGELFNRIPVEVLHEDRLNVVIAPNKQIPFGSYLAQNAAASLNRVLKAQAASGIRADVHVHADGTVHASH